MNIPGNERAKTESVELELCSEILASIEDYCEWANISLCDFIEEASDVIFQQDDEWKKQRSNVKASFKAEVVTLQVV